MTLLYIFQDGRLNALSQRTEELGSTLHDLDSRVKNHLIKVSDQDGQTDLNVAFLSL